VKRLSESKGEDLEKKLVSLHPKFLAIIKEVYPLAVLGSLCVAISAFAHQSYPEAQAFALASASLFLAAFAFSFLFEVSTKAFPYFALMSYISTALAVLLLFATIFQFGVNVPMIGRAFTSIASIFTFVFISWFCYVMYKAVRREEANLFYTFGWIGVILGISALVIAAIDLPFYLFSGESIARGGSSLFVLYFLLNGMMIVFAVIFLYLTRKKAKK